MVLLLLHSFNPNHFVTPHLINKIRGKYGTDYKLQGSESGPYLAAALSLLSIKLRENNSMRVEINSTQLNNIR